MEQNRFISSLSSGIHLVIFFVSKRLYMREDPLVLYIPVDLEIFLPLRNRRFANNLN